MFSISSVSFYYPISISAHQERHWLGQARGMITGMQVRYVDFCSTVLSACNNSRHCVYCSRELAKLFYLRNAIAH